MKFGTKSQEDENCNKMLWRCKLIQNAGQMKIGKKKAEQMKIVNHYLLG